MLVIFHASCADGFCAAWICQSYYPDAEFHAAHYGTEPPDVREKDVMIVDFSYKRDVLERMKEQAKSLVVLDHHKTAEVELKGLPYCIFNNDKSGGRLTWEYLYPHLPAPWLVDYTEDRDLWRWKLPASREISAAMASYPFDFERWTVWNMSEPPVLPQLAIEGTAILRYQATVIDSAIKKVSYVQIGSYKVPCLNCTCLISEICGRIAEGQPFGVTWFQRSDGLFVYSLRSDSQGVDVSAIAKSFGGGGHQHAAGFEHKELIV